MTVELPDIGDWINHDEKAYRVLTVEFSKYSPDVAEVQLNVHTMDDRLRTLYFSVTDLPLNVFSKAMR